MANSEMVYQNKGDQMKKINMKNFVICGAALVFVFVFFQCNEPQEQSAGDIIKGNLGAELQTKLESFINEAIEGYGLPGLAIGIVKDNEIVYARGFGFKNIETREPMTITTLFHMASISKPFVATGIMQLVEKGKIDLDVPVVTYLPYFKLDGEQYKEITIQQMLSHVSGMPDVQDYEWDNPQYDPGALERYVRSLTDKKMRGKPGERFAYSNMAFECLGDVIGKVSGMPFADYEKEYILDPSGMKESTFLKPEGLPENWASPHLGTVRTLVWDGYPYNRMHGPSSTLHSNVVEMCSWAIINMNRGTFKGEKILDPASYDKLWEPMVKTGGSGIRQSVGLSWFIGEYRGEKAIGHGGGDVGFNTMLIMLPEKTIAVVVLCNFIPAPVEEVSLAALDIVLGSEPRELKPPASVRVLRTLGERGVEAAVQEWNSLKQDYPEKYDFGEQQFLNPAGMAVELDSVEDAEDIMRLCLELLSETSLNFAAGYVKRYLKTHPENKAAAVILEMFENR
jgi:CubicO group peptidase (beta-lactamase class C family)